MNSSIRKKIGHWWRKHRRSRLARFEEQDGSIMTRFIAVVGARIVAEWIKELIIAALKYIDQL